MPFTRGKSQPPHTVPSPPSQTLPVRVPASTSSLQRKLCEPSNPMIDHILGKPSPLWRRMQVFLVILFWVFRLYIGDGRIRSNNRLARKLAAGMEKSRWWKKLRLRRGLLGIMGYVNNKFGRFTPYQLIVGTMTAIYALRNLDVLLGLGGPEPLTRLYSRAYYRATYISTAFDAGFVTAMTIRPKWMRDICSVALSGYYLIYAQEADEKLRRYRALCTVEMLRTTWEKTNNPYIRALTYFHRPRLPVVRKLLLPRPKSSKHSKPISAMLFFARPESELHTCTELILDFPGGGFIAMGPDCHEERLRRWAKHTGKPVLSIDYGKAPEYPYPWAIDEGFDIYRILTETKGGIIGMNGQKLDIIMCGDSAGGNIITTIMLRILESAEPIPHPVALVLAYPALDFNFKSFMSPENLRILRSEQSSNHIPGIEESKDHMRHKSPLSVVSDVKVSPAIGNRKSSWTRSLSGRLRGISSAALGSFDLPGDDRREEEKSIQERVKTPLIEKSFEAMQEELTEMAKRHEERKVPQLGTRLTMTSRTGYFQDRIIPPTMMRAMAILYIGPKENPDFETDYYISPILAPERLLAQFPRVFFLTGEKDPFVDDTVILAGKIREAKKLRREEVRRKVSSKAGKVKPGLRMSRPASGPDKEDEAILNEDEDDWVQMRIIEGWGHGFMQMVTIMAEAEPVLLDVADWIDEAFAQHATKDNDTQVEALGSSNAIPHSFSLVKASKYKRSAPEKTLGSADMGVPVSVSSSSSATFETDDEGDGILSFSTKKSKLGSSTSNSSQGTSSRLHLPRTSSAPRFNLSSELLTPTDADLVASVEEAFHAQGQLPYRAPKATFAFFGNQKRTETPTLAIPQQLQNGSASPAASDRSRPSGISEAELLRRRRVEAVYGMGRTDDGIAKVGESEPEETGFRW